MEKYRVLLADDEEEIRTGISRKIDWTALGFSLVGEAANGEEALELAERLAAEEGPVSIELVGLCTDICVVSNALLLKARLPEDSHFSTMRPAAPE